MRIAIEEYSSAWERAFLAERKRLLGTALPVDAHVEHIGSTAVTGLAAKPVIDIMIGLLREKELDVLVGPVRSLGYEYLPEYETVMPFRRFFRRIGDAGVSFHLHAVVKETAFWQDHLLFRDLLRGDDALRTAYEALKKQLSEQEWPSGDQYAAAKFGFIKEALSRGRIAGAGATGRVVYQVSSVPLAPGAWLRPYYLQRYGAMINAAIAALSTGEKALLAYCQKEAWLLLEMPQEIPSLKPEQLKMMIVLEALFEQVRHEEAPTLPSRLASIFTWPVPGVAQRFRDAYFPGGVIHRCVIRSGSALEFDGALLPPGINLDQAGPLAMAEEVRRVRQRAERYWRRAHEPEFPELLVQGTVEVVGREG
ncbi:GrpB family protein [Geobacter sulfurreducens]|uniref:UPF0157 domain protein n=1 Tax=Geobacter sulfurreducens (strain ATCC 51573 / DSM 12127 / PCA) TaxID=243231 RepID=Q74CV0_GEOSL|nr:GrpB family protein [Geobacter sulfurreducens]AAR34945.1 UPF0157 domain protein [Geobacter sulfurreducens PCA]ADI84406.2 UPF0157 domain protein [Geobacter sulfurreducens KN400]AJY71547.1 hypothetical protein RW64_19350 [Geobacter sulfurreducens]UAC05576.1 GrpB family protein [Geobacter sulfurreducens]HBB70934.1 GrpB family protein [Geobacter sulfurreducens]